MKALIAALALAVPSDSLADCSARAAGDISARYMTALLAADCQAELAALSAPASWLAECRRTRSGPNSEHLREFALRTAFTFSGLVKADQHWAAAGVLRGPSPGAVDAALSGQALCGASWTSYRPEGQVCGVDWSAIPVEEYQAAVPLICEGDEWKAGELE